ncbi:hypothetical protein STAS_33925 [Striga asiatica]|uniref:Uncharacterized protein n=1 Tax=Striga asiatica TaxID=4170 RepID=A0A5A7RGD5_STRAF|nr:hypothetical protein STAS_33925 [Striga asiatica]
MVVSKSHSSAQLVQVTFAYDDVYVVVISQANHLPYQHHKQVPEDILVTGLMLEHIHAKMDSITTHVLALLNRLFKIDLVRIFIDYLRFELGPCRGGRLWKAPTTEVVFSRFRQGEVGSIAILEVGPSVRSAVMCGNLNSARVAPWNLSYVRFTSGSQLAVVMWRFDIGPGGAVEPELCSIHVGFTVGCGQLCGDVGPIDWGADCRGVSEIGCFKGSPCG